MFKNIGEKIEYPFLFGIGGIGDFLLTVSDGKYDKESEMGLIFWANSSTTITELSKLFPKIKKKIITPNYLSSTKSHEYFHQIISDKCFLSKSHIPDNLDYINEWYNCDVFTKYNIVSNPSWVAKWSSHKLEKKEPYSVFAPTGGSSDTDWKHKYMKKDLFIKLIEKDVNTVKYIVSTEIELVSIYGDDILKILSDLNCTLALSYKFDALFDLICKSALVYSVDTWVKTLSLLSNVPTILIKSFYEKSPFESMGLTRDPGDCIFIENWNFVKIIEQ